MQISFGRMLVFSLLAFSTPISAGAREYDVGPGHPFATPDRVPWDILQPGDVVSIHWRAEPYRAKWILCCRGNKQEPIIVRGVPDAAGALPVLDGRNAVSPTALDDPAGERGVIKIGGSGFAPGVVPGHIVIENLEIRSARPGNLFLSRRGLLAYSDSASAIYVEQGDHITVRNCVLHDCANGFFTAFETAEILLDGCHVYDNGLEDSIFQHNAYTESSGMVYQFNRFGPLRAGCPGNNIKDRSSGLVVRCNWIEGGNRELDLVDAEDSEDIQQEPRYDAAYVYGNLFIEPDGPDNNQIVHFGGDNGPEETFRQGPLYFYHNTIVSRRAGTTTLLRLSTNDISARVSNNILYVTAPGDQLAIIDDTGLVQLTSNLLKPGWRASHGDLTGLIKAERNIEADDMRFVDPSVGDFRLRADSPAVDRAVNDAPRGHPVLDEFQSPRGRRARPARGSLDLGAFEAAP